MRVREKNETRSQRLLWSEHLEVWQVADQKTSLEYEDQTVSVGQKGTHQFSVQLYQHLDDAF